MPSTPLRWLAFALCIAALGCKDDSSASTDASQPNDGAVSAMSGAGGASGAGAGSGAGGSAGTSGSGGAMDGSLDDAAANDSGMDAAGSSAMDGGTDASPPASSKAYVYIGSGYWGGAEPGRIAVYELEDDGTLSFVDRIDAGGASGIASFMVADRSRRLLYVADEGNGALQRYTVDPATGRLTLDDEVDVSGSPVYVSLDSSGDTLLSASYDEGLVRLFAVGGDGFVEPASDSENTGAETHSIVVSADDAFAYVCNKSTGTLSQFAFDPATHALTALDPATIASPGPRHPAFSADGRFLYVVSEPEDSVRIYARAADGTLSLSDEIARLPVGEAGPGAHVLLSAAGYLYVSNRGPSNSIAVYSVDATNGALTLVEHEPTMGETPRNFTFDPQGRFLLVGNQDSQNVVVFSVDSATGKLEYLNTVDVEGSPFFVGVYTFPLD